jgi:4-hydroxy 2-oxovalerate aldolase
VEDYMLPLKEKGIVWGYDMQYLATGLLNQHPRTAIQFTKEGRKDYFAFYQEMLNLD